MSKYFIFILVFVCNVVQAQLQIKLSQPQLLLRQISSNDIGVKPSLNEHEQQHVGLINKHLQDKNYSLLLKALTDKLKSQLGESSVSAAMTYFLGQLALQQQQYQPAAKYFALAIKKNMSYGQAYHGLGLAQLQLKKYDKATKNLSKAMQLGVQDPQLFSYLGYGYLQANNFHSAVVAYQQAKLFNPDDKQLDQALLYAYSQAGQSEAALSLLSQMLVKQPNEQALWLHRANALLKKKQYINAIASLETALRLAGNNKLNAKNNTENIAFTAQLQMQYGSIERAIQLYENIWNQHKSPELVIEAAEFLLGSGDIKSTEKLLKKLNETSLKNQQLSMLQQSQLAYLAGKVFHQQEKITSAVKMYDKALAFNSVNGHALLALAQVKRAQGKSHQAQMLLLRASTLEEVMLAALTEHADLMMSLGRYKKALTYLQQALAYAPQEQAIFENIKILQRLVNQRES